MQFLNHFMKQCINLLISISAIYEASPAEYNTSSDLVWCDRKSTIKGKGKMRPYDVRGELFINNCFFFGISNVFK